ADRARAQHHALTGHVGHFDSEQIAAHLSPGQAGGLPDLVLAFGHAKGVATNAQEISEILGGYVHRLTGHWHDRLAATLRGAGALSLVLRGQHEQTLDDLAADL